MFDATTLLGAMLGGGFGRRSSLTKVAATAAGVAAVGGLGYMAYRHFQGAPGAAQQPGQQGQQGWGQPAQGQAWGQQQPSAPGWGAPPVGAPAAPGLGGAPQAPTGPAGALGAAGGMLAGFTTGLVGNTGGLRTDGFASSGYGWQAPAEAPAPAAPPAPVAPAPAAPAAPDQATSLLLVRAMVAAAFADGTIDDAERRELVARLEQAGLGVEERAALTAELDAPKPVTLLVTEVKSPAVAEQFYLVSLLSMQIDTDAERSYARMLPGLLGLSPDVVRGIHERAGIPAIA